jgi:streptogramin lyase
VALALLMVAAGALAPRAGAVVYWGNFKTNSIGAASNDGSHVNPNFIPAGGQPRGVAVDAGHVYWADLEHSSIGRANIDGTGVNPSFITGIPGATSLAVDAGHIYFTSGGDAIGRANLDGSNVQQTFIASGAIDITTDANFIYWTTTTGLGGGSIDRANIDGSNATVLTQDRAVENPAGIAVDSGHVYWANTTVEGGGHPSLGRANIDGSAPNANFITAPAFNLALAGGRIYWTENQSNAVAVANADGTAVNRHLFSAGIPAGLAVDSRPGNPPGSTPTSGGGAGGTKGKRCVVPRLIGATLAKAKRLLKRAHCAVGKIVRRPSPKARKGKIVASQPQPGTKLSSGARVGLTVGSG